MSWPGHDDRPSPDDCYWQFHEASGDGNDACPNCGGTWKREERDA